MTEKKYHHLVYGSLEDCLTGEELLDTDDERIRQFLSRMMLEEKGYLPEQLSPRVSVETFFANLFVRSSIELVVSSAGRDFLIIRYGPGSLVSRERAAIAAARVLNDQYRIPLAMVTNGKEAELLDTITGKVLGDGLDSIPDAVLAERLVPDLTYLPPLKNKQRERELRILNAFDLERCCLS
ncbi:type I restriction enzyme HsdR N-terminal domain-containing protein [Desulfotalea psychrophila]|nr:type I restriction enzyme HsdR N-terminal domain-containing protein [Desulfotalea psychrophila]